MQGKIVFSTRRVGFFFFLQLLRCKVRDVEEKRREERGDGAADEVDRMGNGMTLALQKEDDDARDSFTSFSGLRDPPEF